MAGRRTLLPVLVGLLMTLAAPSLPASHIPVLPTGVVEWQGRLAATLNTQYFDPFLEVRGRIEGPEHELRYRSITVGSYARPHPNVKLGVFYRLQAGARHDDDWVTTEAAPGWAWQDTRGRLESVLIGDISPRFLLPFLPGRDWVFMLKARYEINLFDLHQSILLRPGITYFLMRDREPLASFSLAWGVYFPLSFGTTVIYEHAPYLEALVHLGPFVMLEATASLKTVTWSPSQDLKDSGESYAGAYPMRYQPLVFGVGIVLSYPG